MCVAPPFDPPLPGPSRQTIDSRPAGPLHACSNCFFLPSVGALAMNAGRLLPVLLLVGCGAAAWAQSTSPVPLLPESFEWFSPPGIPGLRAAWVVGAEKDSGAYLLRVRLDRGAWIPPHTHPDERSSTVLSGTLYVGFGEVADEAGLVAIPAGGVYVAPANVSHYLWAKDGDVVYQESGVGPTATAPIRP